MEIPSILKVIGRAGAGVNNIPVEAMSECGITVKLPRIAGSHRLAVVNSNVPDMVGRIAHCLGETNHNITHMVNESRKDIAYTLMDIDAAAPQELIDTICSIDGVLSAKAL